MSNKLKHWEHLEISGDLKEEIHGEFDLLEEASYFPSHVKRKKSRAYKDIHHKLVVEEDTPCYICGVTHSVLSDSEKKQNRSLNPHVASQIELHHTIVEWSLANAVDPVKFNATIRLDLMKSNPDNPLYQSEMSQQQILDWVDHGADNLMVLCDVHHRHPYYGIHKVSHPKWLPQRFYTDAFIKRVEDKIATHKASNKINK